MLPGLLRATVLAVAAHAAAPALAQNDDARLAAARAYVEIPAIQAMMGEMLDADSVAAQIRALIPPEAKASEGQLGIVSRIVSEELDRFRPTMERTMIGLLAGTFTTGELEAMTAFYESPEGAEILRKMPLLMQQYYTELGPDLQATMQIVATRAVEALREY